MENKYEDYFCTQDAKGCEYCLAIADIKVLKEKYVEIYYNSWPKNNGKAPTGSISINHTTRITLKGLIRELGVRAVMKTCVEMVMEKDYE